MTPPKKTGVGRIGRSRHWPRKKKKKKKTKRKKKKKKKKTVARFFLKNAGPTARADYRAVIVRFGRKAEVGPRPIAAVDDLFCCRLGIRWQRPTRHPTGGTPLLEYPRFDKAGNLTSPAGTHGLGVGQMRLGREKLDHLKRARGRMLITAKAPTRPGRPGAGQKSFFIAGRQQGLGTGRLSLLWWRTPLPPSAGVLLDFRIGPGPGDWGCLKLVRHRQGETREGKARSLTVGLSPPAAGCGPDPKKHHAD